ncbi:MAG: 2-oxoacid:acceptor oxidoreductase subunit alpha [Anaerolineae bacterium]|nr:MAG: 2-oxoacid:acceptor oxidoreductase subunit alpha [Anaerolineae bacterium]
MTESPTHTKQVVNDFSMVVATANGSGSLTSNLALIRALFRMGIPVSGKNLFPSNIQGLPTWYTIRASSDGHTARRDSVEILVAMNASTFAEDHAGLSAGGACFYADNLPKPRARDDIIYYPMPIRDLVKEVNPPRNLKDYVANMGYVGIVSEMLGIDLEAIRGALLTHFHGREKPVELNMGMITLAAEWARDNLEKQDPYRVQAENKTEGKILIQGNTAGALGAIYGGVSFASWYPITPASSFADALREYLPQLRKDNGKNAFAVIQTEDELAAVGMAIGAGWVGARSMTSTSGPGISLMAEYVGLAFIVEIPLVIWDVQRMGPSTGLPTRTSQGDVMFVRYLGHGDTKNVILLPGSVAECFEFGWRAFDIAERLQTPVFVLSDLDLGMNLWMSDPFDYPDEPMDRGKVLTAEQLEEIGEYARYRDVDGDGITYRTLPGNEHPLAPWFARGTGHDDQAFYSERPDDWERNMERLMRKVDSARELVPAPIQHGSGKARVGLIYYGSTESAVQEARARLSEGLEIDTLRLRAVPFSAEVKQFIDDHEVVYVLEMNTDGQMHKLLQLEVPEQATRLRSLTQNNGLPLTARWIEQSVADQAGG